MKKRIFFSLIFLLLFSTYIKDKNLKTDINFNIKEIIIENNFILDKTAIKREISFLYEKNLFFLDDKKILQKLNKKSFIESFEIKKLYPNKLKIKIYEKKPIFVLQNKEEKFYYTDKDDLVDFFYLEAFKNLPIIFGNEKDFKIFYNELKSIDFPIEIIKTFYYFDLNRWDLLTSKNQTLKLPVKNYNESLKNFLKIKDDNNFQKFQIFDYRIKNQLILK